MAMLIRPLNNLQITLPFLVTAGEFIHQIHMPQPGLVNAFLGLSIINNILNNSTYEIITYLGDYLRVFPYGPLVHYYDVLLGNFNFMTDNLDNILNRLFVRIMLGKISRYISCNWNQFLWDLFSRK